VIGRRIRAIHATRIADKGTLLAGTEDGAIFAIDALAGEVEARPAARRRFGLSRTPMGRRSSSSDKAAQKNQRLGVYIGRRRGQQGPSACRAGNARMAMNRLKAIRRSGAKPASCRLPKTAASPRAS